MHIFIGALFTLAKTWEQPKCPSRDERIKRCGMYVSMCVYIHTHTHTYTHTHTHTRPHRRQPTRLPHPWDSPGKNTEVGCHFLPQCMKSESEVSQSCPTLSDPLDCSLPGSSIHGIFQARVLEWGAIAFSNMLAECTHILHIMEVIHSSFGG